MWKRSVLEKAFNQLMGEGHRFHLVKGEHPLIPLPFFMSSLSLSLSLFFICNNGFHALMIHLCEPDQKYQEVVCSIK